MATLREGSRHGFTAAPQDGTKGARREGLVVHGCTCSHLSPGWRARVRVFREHSQKSSCPGLLNPGSSIHARVSPLPQRLTHMRCRRRLKSLQDLRCRGPWDLTSEINQNSSRTPSPGTQTLEVAWGFWKSMLFGFSLGLLGAIVFVPRDK